MKYLTCWGKLKIYRKTIITILTPILLLPLLILSSEEYYEEAACGFSILLMAVYWITEVVPLAVTALLPLVLYPILGVLPARTVCLQYFKDVNILFLGGLTVAVAVEHWNLHKRVALKVLTLVGAKPKWLLFGFMTTTAFLSMWISNVATTAMMVPIAQAVLDEMKEEDDMSPSSSGTSTPDRIKQDTVIEVTEPNGETKEFLRLQRNSLDDKMELINEPNGIVLNGKATHNQLQVSCNPDDVGNEVSTEFLVQQKSPMLKADEEIGRKRDADKSYQGMCKALTICICYSANIGGTATLTGTGPNLILAGQFRTKYPDAPEVDFGRWMLFAFVGMFIYLMICWVWLQFMFLDSGIQDMLCCKKSVITAKQIQGERIIKKQYTALGSMSFAETTVLVMFCIMAFLWLTRDPGFVNGWGSLPFFKSRYVTDATVAMTISFLLFLLPSEKPNFLKRNSRPRNVENVEILASNVGPVPPILTWKVLNEKMAWNVILLLGGGFAMALGAKESGLSVLIGEKLEPLKAFPPIYAAFICCFVISLLTQCTSNTATATVFIPILAELGEILQVNPLYLMLPATLTTSYAFMFPVSTPPNAISYSYGHLKMMDMVKAGSLLNIIGLFVAIFSVYFLGGPSFDLFNDCPYWLESPYCLSLNTTVVNETSTVLTNIVNATLS